MNNVTEEVKQVIDKSVAIIAFPASNKGVPTSAFENSVYRNYRSVYDNYLLATKRDGDIVPTRVKPRLIFCPMICIQGEYTDLNQHPLSYSSLESSLMSVRELSINLDIPVYIPQFYASPKKDKWDNIKQIIQKTSKKFTIWESEKTLTIR